MLSYGEYEKLIINRLKKKGIYVSPLPFIDDLNQTNPLRNPRIYVILTGSTFEDLPNLGDFTQNEQISFDVYVQARTRDGEKGVFLVIEWITEQLLKWEVPDATEKITLNSFEYVTGIQNYWQYQLKFGFPRIRIKPEIEKEEVLLTKVGTIFKEISQNEPKNDTQFMHGIEHT